MDSILRILLDFSHETNPSVLCVTKMLFKFLPYALDLLADVT